MVVFMFVYVNLKEEKGKKRKSKRGIGNSGYNPYVPWRSSTNV